MMNTRPLAVMLGLLPNLASGASEAPSAVSMEPVVVTPSRSPAPLLELAGNTATVTAEEIGLVSPPHIDEVMARLPGTWVTRSAGTAGHLTAIRSPLLSGPGACGAFLFMEHGVPVSGRGFCNINELFSLNTEQAGTIEVMRGPGSAYHGSDALHGLVNVLTREPAETTEYLTTLEAGRFDFKRLKATGSTTRGAHGWRLSANATDSDAFQEQAGFDQQKLTLRHDFQGDQDAVRTLVSGMNLRDRPGGFVEGFEAYRDRQASQENPNPDAFRDAVSLRAQSQWEHFLDDRRSLRLTPYARRNAMTFSMHWLPGDVEEENRHTSAGLQTELDHWFAAGHRLRVGTDMAFTRGRLEETQAGPDATFGGYTRYSGEHYDYEVEVSALSPFIHGEWQITDQWRLTGGARLDFIRYDYTNHLPDGNVDDQGDPCTPAPCLYNRPADRTDRFLELSPQLGANYRLTPQQALFVNLAQGFRAPQTNELYRLQREQNVADIDPVRLDSLETGARGRVGRLRYDTALFFMKKKNFIFRDSNFFMVDGGRSRHYGLEAELSYRLAPAWDVAFNGTYGVHQFAKDKDNMDAGNDIPHAPRIMAATRLGWDFRADSRAELEWVRTGDYYLDEANERRYEGHDLLHLRLATRLTPRWRLFGRITNLTDARYAARADYAFGGYRYFVGQPRAGFMGVEAVW